MAAYSNLHAQFRVSETLRVELSIGIFSSAPSQTGRSKPKNSYLTDFLLFSSIFHDYLESSTSTVKHGIRRRRRYQLPRTMLTLPNS